MTITLPITEDQHRPLHRILVSPQWGNASWEVLPMSARLDVGVTTNGYEVQRYWRRVLPNPGDATFLYHFGTINQRIYGIDSSGGARDLQGYYVRIQRADGPTTSDLKNGLLNVTLNWKTVFTGTVEYPEDHGLPAASSPIGFRIYRCKDLLSYAARWPLLYHGYKAAVCRGHPGYNTMLSNGTIAGDQDSSATVNYQDDDPGSPCHTQRGQGDLWTDLDVVNDVLLIGRQQGDPILQISEDYGLLSNSGFWPVTPTENALGFISQILRRQRGRGLAFLNWDDDTDDPLGPLNVYITVNSQVADDITYTDPITTEDVTLPGARTNGTLIDLVDLVGDQRNVEETFRLGERGFNYYGYIESIGDPIEVLITLSYADGTLEQRWVGHPSSVTADPADEPVYQLHSTPKAWDLTAGDGTGDNSGPIDYRCDDDGNVIEGGAGDTSPIISHHNLEVLGDTMVPSAGDQAIGELRGQPGAYYSGSSPDTWISIRTELASGGEMTIRDDGILIKAGGDEIGLFRAFSDTSIPALGALANFTALAITVALQLPHHIRMATGDPTSPRRKTLEHHGLRLWLIDDQAIVNLDFSAGNKINGHPAIRGGIGTDVGPCAAMVDDRAKLAFRHSVAVQWYGIYRNTCSWQLRACGFASYFLDINGNQITYPTLGSVVAQIGANGQLNDLGTPITSMGYEAVPNTTTWITDWSDLDLANG